MKKVVVAILVIALFAGVIWFFMTRMGGSNSSLGKHIPANSQMVFSVNLKSIAQKADLAKFKDSEILTDLLKQADSSVSKLIREAIDNPENTGIDFGTNPTFFMSNMDNKPQAGLVLKLKDSEKFAGIAKKIADKDAKVQTIGNNSYYNEEGEKSVVMWNKETVLLYNHPTSKTAVAKADSLINGSSSSINDNKYYSSSKMSSDISMYMNYNELIASQKTAYGMNPLQEMNFPTKFHVLAGLSFNEGKIELTSETVYEDKKDEERMNFNGAKLDNNLLGLVAGEAPIIAAQGKMEYGKFFDFLMDSKEIAKSLGSMAEELGVTRGELRDLLNGEVALAFTGMEQKEVTKDFFGSQISSTKNIPHAAIYLGLKDKEVWKKLIEKSRMVKEDGRYKIPFFGQIEFNIVETENGIVIAVGDSEIDKLVKDGKMSDGNFEAINKLKKSGNEAISYMNMDIKSWPENTRTMMKDNFKPANFSKLEMAMEPFNYAYGNVSGKNTGSFIIVMSDEKANSLTQILDMSNKMYLINKKEQEERKKAYEEMMQQYQNEGFESEEDEEVEIIEEPMMAN